MENKRSIFIFFLIGIVLLSPSFYRDQWKVVEPEHYRLWERTYDRVVVARVALSQQHGVFSSAGLLGLANVEDKWDFNPDSQFEIYFNGEAINKYRVYRSHPGFQGFAFSLIDEFTNFSPQQNVELFRAIVSLISAIVISIFATLLAIKFGWLSGLLILLFSTFSEWMILPGGNTYWNLWAFYLPFLASILVLEKETRNNTYNSLNIHIVLFVTTLIKILVTGFEMITTTLVMATVPFVYYAILNKWGGVLWKRLMYLGIALTLATMSGLLVLMIQIAWNDGTLESSFNYISNTLDRRAFGDPNEQRGQSYDEGLKASDLSVIRTYLNTNAFNSQTPQRIWQRPYWEIIMVFALCTIFFLVRRWSQIKKMGYEKEMALIAATWYSLAAPLSWYIIFTATSYEHPFLFPMAWQMPFTLLGFALCGFVIQDLFKSKTTRAT
jgi:hypothetical protein